MSLLLDDRKVTAAAKSMKQYYPTVRALFPVPVADDVVEVTTLFLYGGMARDVFGRRFARRFAERIGAELKYVATGEAQETIDRVARAVRAFSEGSDPLLGAGVPTSAYEHYVRSTIKALLTEAGIPIESGDVVSNAFVPLESVLDRIRAHLVGIKRQNPYLM